MARHRKLAGLAVALSAAAWAAAATLGRTLGPRAGGTADVAVVLALACTYTSVLALSGLRARSPRRFVMQSAVTTLVLATGLLLGEAPALLRLVDYGRLLQVVAGEWNGPATDFESDPVLAWSRPPHRNWSGRPRSDMAIAFNLPVRAASLQSFTTDAHGFRNRHDRPRADVVLVGDSFVEGAYVSDEETVAVELEHLTGRNVTNLGRSGYGTLQELEVLRLHALPLHPRAVAWFFYEGNDLYDDETYENALLDLRVHGRYSRRVRLEDFWSASLSVNGFRLLRRALDPLVPVSAPSFGLFREPSGETVKLYFYEDAALRFEAFEESRLVKAQDALRRGAALLRERSIALVLAFVPSKFRVYGGRCDFPDESSCARWRLWDLEARFKRFCAREGLPLLDLTASMQTAAASGRILYAPEDSHWNAAGHRFVAERLVESLSLR